MLGQRVNVGHVLTSSVRSWWEMNELMRHRTVMLCGLAMALSASAPLAQTFDKLVGSWKLIEASVTSATGLVDHAPFGTALTGTLIYTPNRRVAVLISYGGRKSLSGSDRMAAPAEERAEAFKTFFAYSGRYSVTADKITHHVEVASYQNWVNTDLVRTFTLKGERLTLRTPPLSVGGAMQVWELVWERVP